MPNLHVTDFMRVARGSLILAEHFVTRSSAASSTQVQTILWHYQELCTAILDHGSTRSSNGCTHGFGSSGSKYPVAPHSMSPLSSYAEPAGSQGGSHENIIGFPPKHANSLDQPKIKSHISELPNLSASMRELSVPSSRLSRVAGFGGLAVRLAASSLREKAGNMLGSSFYSTNDNQAPVILADTLSRMRGAALKLGQMLSLQDSESLDLPSGLSTALERVRHAADYMPASQLDSQMRNQLGDDWETHFTSFERTPIAAASIGQVHKARTVDGRLVAVKVQYPGVAGSIDSDLQNLRMIVTYTSLLPPGLFVDQIISVAGEELKLEW